MSALPSPSGAFAPALDCGQKSRPHYATKAEWAKAKLTEATTLRSAMEQAARNYTGNDQWRQRKAAQQRVLELIAEEASWRQRADYYKRRRL